MIITIECTQEERQAIKAMAQKYVVKNMIEGTRKVITPKGENTVEIKPALIVAAAKLVEIVAPLVTSELYAWKNTLEAIKPYFVAVKKAAEEEG